MIKTLLLVYLLADGPIIGAGIFEPAAATDACGNIRPDPPSVGAFDVNSNCESVVSSDLFPAIIIELEPDVP